MIHHHMDFLNSDEFLLPLGIPTGTQLQFDLLGQGEYNLNYTFAHPVTGQKLVLRINTGSQMHLENQIGYEYAALQALAPSGRTPRPFCCWPEAKAPVWAAAKLSFCTKERRFWSTCWTKPGHWALKNSIFPVTTPTVRT